jgi:hypothetical protein
VETTSDTTTKPESLDERKLQYDIAARQRELDLREREIVTKEREVSSKEKELERSRWLNPMVIGIFAASIGLISSILVAYLNNKATQEQERQRGQSTIILEAIRTGTGNTDASCKNLLFLANLRLIDDPKGTIGKQCASVRGGIPSLPAAGEVARFARSAELTPEIEATLKQTLIKYREYLSKFGIHPPVVPEVIVDEAKIKEFNCWHACDVEDTIYLLPGHATPALVAHEFTHTVFLQKANFKDRDKQWSYSAIEAGFANYLTADFLGSPVIDDYSLEDNPKMSFSQIPHSWDGGQGEGGRAWGEFLWRLRGEAGSDKDRVTKIAVRTLIALKPTEPAHDYQAEFLQALIANGLKEEQVQSAVVLQGHP